MGQAPLPREKVLAVVQMLYENPPKNVKHIAVETGVSHGKVSEIKLALESPEPLLLKMVKLEGEVKDVRKLIADDLGILVGELIDQGIGIDDSTGFWEILKRLKG